MFDLLISLVGCASVVCEETPNRWNDACVAVTARRDPVEDPGTDEVGFLLVHDEWSQRQTGTWDEPAGLWFPGFEGVVVKVESIGDRFYCSGTTTIDLEEFGYQEVEVQTTCVPGVLE